MSETALERRRGGMRDAAIVRATVRELLPLWLGTLALGWAVGMATGGNSRGPGVTLNTWPLLALPAGALWGGLFVGGGSRSALVHLFSRPVSRVRVLAWRWTLLVGGLALVALLMGITSTRYGGGPDPSAIAIATVLASLWGAQGGTLSEREPVALGAALTFGGALILPVQLGLQAEQLTWTRMNEMLGWGWLVLLAVAVVLLAAPVVWAWRRTMPMRGVEASTQLVLGSLGGTVILFAGVVLPTMAWVASPARGQLIAVVGITQSGPIVATGTLGEDGERDVVDGLIEIDASGERRVVWNRRDEAPDEVVWHVARPRASELDPNPPPIVLMLIEGSDLAGAESMRNVELDLPLVDAPPNPFAASAIERQWNQRTKNAYGSVRGPMLTVTGQQIREGSFELDWMSSVQTIRSSEIPFGRVAGHAIGNGRLWAVIDKGVLWSYAVPWERER